MAFIRQASYWLLNLLTFNSMIKFVDYVHSCQGWKRRILNVGYMLLVIETLDLVRKFSLRINYLIRDPSERIHEIDNIIDYIVTSVLGNDPMLFSSLTIYSLHGINISYFLFYELMKRLKK